MKSECGKEEGKTKKRKRKGRPRKGRELRRKSRERRIGMEKVKICYISVMHDCTYMVKIYKYVSDSRNSLLLS